MLKNLNYRQCELKDLYNLILISRNTFVEAYEKDNDPEDFKSYMNSAFNSVQLRTELEHPNTEFYFMYLKNALVGYYKLNDNQAQCEDYGDKSLELSRIYILNDFQGRNIGKLTLFKVIELAKEKGKHWIWLSDWQLNDPAVRF